MNQKISVSSNVTLVTLQNTPVDIDFIATVFEEIAALNIDINMISFAPVQGALTDVSFTISDDDLVPLLSYTSKLKDKKVKVIVSSGNSIISILDNNMENNPGVAAKILRALANANSDFRIVTTSEVQISLLVTQAAFEKAHNAILNA